MKKLIVFLLTLSGLFFSCSSDSDDSMKDPIIGTWEGSSVQEGLGSIQVTIVISTLEIGQKSGSLTSFFKDSGGCDKNLFFCDPFTCASDWVYNGKSGSAYLFTELALPGSACAEKGDIQLSFSGTNKLVGTASFDVDPTNVVKIVSNQITLSRVK